VLLSHPLATIVSIAILLSIPLMALRFGLRFGFTGMANGLRWAIASGHALLRFRQSGLYDLLCLTPSGPLGVNWAVSTGIFYRLLRGSLVQSQDLWAVRLYIILPLTFFLTTRSTMLDHPYIVILNMLLHFGLIVVWFRLEDTQSITLGGLTGMLIPTYTRNFWEVRLAAFGLYTLVQVLIYTSAVIFSASILPPVYRMLGLQGWLVGFSYLVLALLLLGLLRELANQILWRTLVARLDLGSEVSIELVQRVY
jgi:hypothetical protein